MVGYSLDIHLDNYNERMSRLKERILGDKFIDCYYHLLFIVIIVITLLLLLFIFTIIAFVYNYNYYYCYSY